MTLLLDAGNTRLKWALQAEGKLDSYDSCDYESLIHACPEEWNGIAAPDQVYMASVTSRYRPLVEQRVKEQWGVSVQIVSSASSCAGVENGYRDPDKLGSDRWAALLGAWSEYGAPLCVADCGTALTVDALDDTGKHLGGFIVPGLRMQGQLFNVLSGDMDKVTRGAVGEFQGWGRDTQSGLAGGSLLALAGTIERSVKLLAKQCAQMPLVVLTGGDALQLLPLLECDVRYDEHLVIKGIALMARDIEGSS